MGNQLDDLMTLLMMTPEERRVADMEHTMVDIMRLMYQAGVQGQLEDEVLVRLIAKDVIETGDADTGEVEAVLEVIGGLIEAHTVAGEWLLRTEKSARKRRIELMAEEATAMDGGDSEL